MFVCAYLWFELADATNYVNDVGPGMVFLYMPVYRSYNYESFNKKYYYDGLIQARFKLFSQKSLL